jgi:hypothetical protein
LHKISQTTEQYQEEMRMRARAALKQQRLPDDTIEIINGLASINEEDYSSYDAFMAAVQENENLIRQIKGRAEGQVNYDQKQVELLQEQIALAKEALLKEKTELQEYIKDLQEELKDAYKELQTMWDEGLGLTNGMLTDIVEDMRFYSDRLYLLHEMTFPSILETLRSIDAKTILSESATQATVQATELTVRENDEEDLAQRDRDEQFAELVSEMKTLRKETRETQLSLVTYARRYTDIVNRWEGDGIPADREDYLRQIAYNTRRTTTQCEG